MAVGVLLILPFLCLLRPVDRTQGMQSKLSDAGMPRTSAPGMCDFGTGLAPGLLGEMICVA